MIGDIWRDFSALPLWVQGWVMVVLLPVNFAPLAFLDQPGAWRVAALALGGIAPNIVIMFVKRGFPSSMAIPHLIFWLPLIAVLGWLINQGQGTDAWLTALWLLLVVDVISLGFDARDFRHWLRRNRSR